MYPFITIPVQFISSFFGITCAMIFQLIYSGTYTHIHPEINLPVYLDASLPSNHKDLPVSTTTLRVHFQTFILITIKIYPSTFLLFYMSTEVPVHHYTCSVYLFLFGITSTITFQLVYWGSYTSIHLKINLPVYPHAFLWSNNKDLLSPQLLVYLPIDVLIHDPTCSFSVFLKTIKIYPSMFILFYMSTDVLVHHYKRTVYFFFFSITCTMTFQLIYWGTYTQIHPKLTCLPSSFSSV